jgi:DNA-binding response OmpR family regulator
VRSAHGVESASLPISSSNTRSLPGDTFPMPTARQRILCVEDHQDTRSMLTNVLEHEGYFVIAAEDATQGLAVAQTWPFDLLIIDIWLPDENGHELCRRVREFDQYTPIIVYSGAARESDEQEAVTSEADAFVAKPDVNKLLETVRYFLR